VPEARCYQAGCPVRACVLEPDGYRIELIER
jgi:hypothetical protein